MSIDVPTVRARVTLLPELSHGRWLIPAGQYRPDIVIGPAIQRTATREGNFTETYHAVMFVGGPDELNPGDTAEVSLALRSFPENPYAELQPGATFTIREGSKVVGFGEVLSRGPESFHLPLTRH